MHRVGTAPGLRARTALAHPFAACFATWAPKLWAYYSEHNSALYASDARLTRNFENSAFASATFNFGPQTCCRDHTDSGNLPFGWCAVTALGDFNPKLGGHLVLWDLKVVIEFPPGSTILIPSATLRHSNTTIAKGETRYSFTQYSAGGLFRWVDQGFQKSPQYWGSLTPEEHAAAREECNKRWGMGIGLFSTLESLQRPDEVLDLVSPTSS